MISFRQYISEEEEAKANMPLITHIMSGPYGKKSTEHDFNGFNLYAALSAIP